MSTYIQEEFWVQQLEQQQQEGGSSGGNTSSSPQLNPQDLLALYQQQLPATLQMLEGTTGGAAQSVANAAAGSNPIYTQAGLNQLQQYAPGYQQAGGQLAQGQAGITNQLLQGAGGQAAASATNLSNYLNPVQATAQGQANNLLNSINLNGLTGGETAGLERNLNDQALASGNVGNATATTTGTNALQFGQALQQKQALLGSALNSASNVASNQNQFANPVGTAINSGNTSNNFGLGTFNPTQGNQNANQAFQFGSSLFSPLSSNASASNSLGNQSSAQGGLCCFIFLESYNGKLPESVRKCRDYYYSKQPKLAIGYKRMAKWLVPLMKRYQIVRLLVNKLMVKPMTNYGEYLVGNTNKPKGRLAKSFWFTTWNILGTI